MQSRGLYRWCWWRASHFLGFYGTRFEVNNQKVIEYLEKKNDFLSPFHLALINLISAAQKQNKNWYYLYSSASINELRKHGRVVCKRHILFFIQSKQNEKQKRIKLNSSLLTRLVFKILYPKKIKSDQNVWSKFRLVGYWALFSKMIYIIIHCLFTDSLL